MDYYNYDSAYASDADPAVVAGVMVFLIIFWIAAYAIGAFLLGRLFKKAGIPQWTAWVPIYNTWKLLEMGGQQGFWAVLALIPFVQFVSLIFIIMAMYHIGKKLGKEGWFVLLAIFLPVVWLIWLAFDDSKWPKAQKTVAKKT